MVRTRPLRPNGRQHNSNSPTLEPRAMGHIRLGHLPRTREWKDVVRLLIQGANADQVAIAAIHAVEAGLRKSASDPGVVATVRLLLKIPLAARQEDFAGALSASSVHVPPDPTYMDVLAGFADAV